MMLGAVLMMLGAVLMNDSGRCADDERFFLPERGSHIFLSILTNVCDKYNV
jgi:hypothetical protein